MSDTATEVDDSAEHVVWVSSGTWLQLCEIARELGVEPADVGEDALRAGLKAMREADASRVACPRCAATPGAPCKRGGGPRNQGVHHGERRVAARKAAR